MFKVSDNGTIAVVVDDATGRTVARWLSAAKAQGHADYLNSEHAKGQVTHHRCREGFFCDHDRVHGPEWLTDAERASLVLCDWHGRLVDERRAKGRAA